MGIFDKVKEKMIVPGITREARNPLKFTKKTKTKRVLNVLADPRHFFYHVANTKLHQNKVFYIAVESARWQMSNSAFPLLVLAFKKAFKIT